MTHLRKISLTIATVALVAQLACSDNPSSSALTFGTIKVSVKTTSSGTPKSATLTSITSARLVIQKIELESSLNDTLDYELEQPFVQELLVGSSLHEIETLEVPLGSYEELDIKMDDLESDDGLVYVQNPELQERSILIEGFLNGDTAQPFVFASEISQDQQRVFDPPIVLDENSPATNIVLAIDMDRWFLDENDTLLDPRDTNNKSAIENSIKNSFKVFEDRDDDGEEDPQE